jgi:hypothetical protein
MEKNLREGAELIAKFIGAEYDSELKYNTSWDLLMPIWKKFRVWCWENTMYNSDFEKHKEAFMSGVFNADCHESFNAITKALAWRNSLDNH